MDHAGVQRMLVPKANHRQQTGAAVGSQIGFIRLVIAYPPRMYIRWAIQRLAG